MPKFDMTLRGRRVQVKATIESMDPIQFTVELRDKKTAQELDWELSRAELTKLVRHAANASKNAPRIVH